jgi:hypothetical protein
LTLPFKARFEQLGANERKVYLITVALSVVRVPSFRSACTAYWFAGAPANSW